MRFGLFLFLLLHAFITMGQSGQEVILRGNAIDYAGYHLVMQKIINPISMESVSMLTIEVDENGDFNQTVDLYEVSHVSLDMGRYRAYIYLEPGKAYELVLPPFMPRSDADRFNPYFIPEDVVLGIANKESQGLNQEISQFDQDLFERYNANAVKLFAKGDKVLAEKLILELDSLYPAKVDSYFQKYKQYAYGELLMLAYRRQKRQVMNRIMSGDIAMQMPSFIKILNTSYKNFFTNYFGTPQGEPLRLAYANKAPFDSLVSVLKTDTIFTSNELAEVVLLKGLYDAFYSGQYGEEQIIELFKQGSEDGCTKRIRDIASGLYKKVTWLRTGSDAPQFTLYRLDGKERSLSDYKGKFVYLNFMHTDNHSCKKDLQLLHVLSKELKRELTIVTIILDEDPGKAKELIKANGYKWDFLHYNAQPKVILDYNIQALPAYFVIDPKQSLRLSPAPSPTESFTPIFIEAHRDYNYEQLRKNKPKQKTIYDL